MYENYTFEELNNLMEEKKENAEEELVYHAISKGVKVIELFIVALTRKYSFNYTREDIYNITNSTLDNLIKYYSVKKGTNLKAYMFSTARGKFLNYFRDKFKDRHEMSYNEKTKDDGIEIIELMQDSKNGFENIEEHIMVREAFSQLNEMCKKALYYRKVMEYSVDKIGELLEIKTMPNVMIRKQISNCLKKLKNNYEGLRSGGI